MENSSAKRILVAMSGGVDSSVAAALLKKQGYSVMGGYMKNFSPESWEGVISKDCPWERDMEDVAKVCAKLGIEWRSFNFEEEYREKVIEYFFREYAEGRTPNPDVLCNSEIKFGIFLEEAIKMGFDYIATGHYVKKIGNKLFQAKDKNKDQSYFLWKLTPHQISKSLFPLGDLIKLEVRNLARKFGLHTAEKKDSQGVCFVGQIKLKDFLKQRIPAKQGEIKTSDGKKIGTHEGISYYTIGQREGLGLSGGPFYVAKKDAATNTLVVTKDLVELGEKECAVRSINWISGNEPEFPLRMLVKIRYQSSSVPAVLYKIPRSRTSSLRGRQDTRYKIQFDASVRSIAPGQGAVFYTEESFDAAQDKEMLGGGIIDKKLTI